MKSATIDRASCADDALSRIQQQAERIKSDAKQQFPDAASIGDSWRQGDIYITRLNGVPAGSARVEKPDRQLAPGNTQGSRHCLQSLRCVKVFRVPNAGMLDGPVLDIGEANTITHPEHGDVALQPGVYGISYQRDLDAEDRERRVLD